MPRAALSVEQARAASPPIDGTALCVVAGGPGTGKTSAAIARAAFLAARLEARKDRKARILFVCGEPAMVPSIRRELAGRLETAGQVEVTSIDRLALEAVAVADPGVRLLSRTESEVLAWEVGRRLAGVEPGFERGFSLAGVGYAMDEIAEVILGLGLGSEAEYLGYHRRGRRATLNLETRRSIWRFWQALSGRLQQQRRVLAPELAGRALATARPRFDAVVVDDAHHLRPVEVSLLLALAGPGAGIGLFQDPNQAGPASRIWGRDALVGDPAFALRLSRRYRSTGAIGAAATAYLRAGGAGSVLDVRTLAGPATPAGDRPVLALAANDREEIRLVAYRLAASRLPLGRCAVVTEDQAAARALAVRLSAGGLAARAAESRSGSTPGSWVQVVGLAAAAAIDADEVVICGLRGWGDGSAPEPDPLAAELADPRRRAVYRAMSAASASLMVVRQAGIDPVAAGFDPSLWEVVG